MSKIPPARVPSHEAAFARQVDMVSRLINTGLVVDSDTVRALRLPDNRIKLVRVLPSPTPRAHGSI